MVERADHLLRTELHEPLGLASPNVQVLDPCCGTGAYLVEVLHRIERTLREQAGDDDALVSADLRRAATTRIFGFEIMPAPFVIAHLQVANLLEKTGSSLAAHQRAQVFLTNALTGWVPARHPQSNFGFPAFTEERDAAEAIKRADTILVILGNPPYNGYPGIASIEEERNLTESYRQKVPNLPAPQGQGLNELYVRFFRVAERRIAANRSQTGIVSFISGYRWLDGLSHPTMRYHFLQEFDSIYIDNLNGDKYRTGKTTPDGKPDPSAFSTPQNREGIQVGTAISTLVRTLRPKPARAIKFRDLWGTTKLSVLDREAKQNLLPEYELIQPAPALGLPFADRQHSEAVATWPTLPSLLPTFFPGVKTSRDPLAGCGKSKLRGLAL
jgi:predicted helicase